MKHLRKRNGGFTLVELVVTIAIASIVTAAATTVLMLAMRVNRQASDTASQQNTVRALLSTMEKAAADGNIKGLVSDFDSWQLIGEKADDEQPAPAIFEYVSKEQTIYANGAEVLKGVYASHAVLEGKLLTISIETAVGTYSSTVWCRMAPSADGEANVGEGDATPIVPGGEGSVDANLAKFLEALKLQYGSRGEIIGGDGMYTYYSEWYIQQKYANGIGPNGWNADTPWCACYVSWALVEANVAAPAGHPRWFAEVDNFMDYFMNVGSWQETSPTSGNLIFFDWDLDGDAQHMGVVLSVSGGTIYTIEGNSAGRVAIRSYPIDDPRILGYGVLSWN